MFRWARARTWREWVCLCYGHGVKYLGQPQAGIARCCIKITSHSTAPIVGGRPGSSLLEERARARRSVGTREPLWKRTTRAERERETSFLDGIADEPRLTWLFPETDLDRSLFERGVPRAGGVRVCHIKAGGSDKVLSHRLHLNHGRHAELCARRLPGTKGSSTSLRRKSHWPR